jgi:hypothetical protein
MKKSILLSGILLISAMAIAQEPEKMQQPSKSNPNETPSLGNEIVEMKDGKVWLTKDGQISLLSKEINLGGSKVSTDGTVLLKDGRKLTLKNGDRITSDGNLVKAPEKQPYNPEQKAPEMK